MLENQTPDNFVQKKAFKVFDLHQPFVESSRDNKSGIEGKIITRRSLSKYERALQFKRELLRDKTILNFGCGGTNLHLQLKKEKINANVIDLDIQFNPIGSYSVIFIVKTIDYLKSKINKTSKFYTSLTDFKKYVEHIEERKIIQGDGRNLPFADKTFDISLALWSTYQIPDEAKKQVFKELMRTSNIIHIGPIFKKDYTQLIDLSEEMKFNIVICTPFTTFLMTKKDAFIAKSVSDYDKYIKNNEPKKRIVEPKDENPRVFRINDNPVLATGKGGDIMILKRQKE